MNVIRTYTKLGKVGKIFKSIIMPYFNALGINDDNVNDYLPKDFKNNINNLNPFYFDNNTFHHGIINLLINMIFMIKQFMKKQEDYQILMYMKLIQ